MIEKLRHGLLTLSTILYDNSVSYNLLRKAEMRRFGNRGVKLRLNLSLNYTRIKTKHVLNTNCENFVMFSDLTIVAEPDIKSIIFRLTWKIAATLMRWSEFLSQNWPKSAPTVRSKANGSHFKTRSSLAEVLR